MTKEGAKKIGDPKTISDLKGKEATLAITGFPECKQRQDCLLGVEDTYGLKFGKFVSSEQKYQVLDSGDADVAFIFTTDGDLAGGKYAILDDDKKFFPPYNVTFDIRNEALKTIGPEGQKVIEDVQKPLTEKVMQELNARVDIDKQKPEAGGQELPPAGRFRQVILRIPAPAVWRARDNRGRMLARVAAPLLLALVLAGLRRLGRSGRSTPARREDAASAKAINAQPGERGDDADDRLEELHRGVHPRRDLRAGARGRRLQGPQAPEPRLGEGRLRRRQVGRGRRLPGVHRHGADDVLRRPDRQDPQGRAAGLRPGEGELRQAAA